MDTPKKKHWFKRIFLVDYGIEPVTVPEEIAPIIEAEDVAIYAQADLKLAGSVNSNISVSIDNINKVAYVRFGSSEAVDTVNAVWFISKTGNKIANNFGDELSPNAPRLTVQKFLQETQDKQGPSPLDDLVPPHDHETYQEEIDANTAAISKNTNEIDGIWRNLNSFADAINTNRTNIATNTDAIAVNTAAIAVNTAAIAVNTAAIAVNSASAATNAYEIALLSGKVDDIESFLGAVSFEISLGTGNWIFDSTIPPVNSHFTAFSATFDANNNQFWINGSDSRASDIDKWSMARAGDRFRIASSGQDKADYILETITWNSDDAVWYITALFVEGKGSLNFGAKYDINITRKTNSFYPVKN